MVDESGLASQAPSKDQRIQTGLVSRYERVALGWMVSRVPERVTPDILTGIGMFGAFLTLAGYGLTQLSPGFLWLASFGLVVHWLGDSLDGNLARYRKIERPRYGYFVDQTADVIGNLLIGLGIAISPFVRTDVALFTLTGYHMLSIYVFVRAYVSREFHVTVLNSGPTEIRLMIIAMNMLILLVGAPEFEFLNIKMTWCDVAMSALSIGFIIAFIYLVMNYAKILRAADDKENAS